MTQLIRCTPWIMRLHLHPTIVKKMRTFLEMENKMGLIIHAPVNQFRPPLLETNPNIRRMTQQKRGREPHPKRSLGQPPPELLQCTLHYQKPLQSPEQCIISTSERRYPMAWCRQDVWKPL